jgi:tetratricopeptide (TPR) repeat protein
MSASRAYVSEIVLPTYEVLEANPNPVYHETKGYIHPYPYPLQDSVAESPADKTYVTAVLENDFLKVTVIPALGGRLYSASDKKTGQELFYKNDTVRPQPLAARGAWFSGGLEFNFPVSHSPQTMEPMDWLVRQNADGSASLIFGKTEKLSWMRFLVELRLPADQSMVEERVTCRNPAWLPARFYFWSNAAVRALPSTRFLFPFDYTYTYEFHGVSPWPYTIVKYTAHEPFFADADIIHWPDSSMPGVRNLSLQKEIVQHASIFGADITRDFFAAYQPAADFATVHYADHRILRGAKFWSWGQSGHDRLCQENLTRDAGYYAEIQSGPFETQSDFRMLEPGQDLSWEECWFPVAGTGGILAAARGIGVNLALDLADPGSSAGLLVYSAADLSRVRLVFSVAGREILDREIQLRAASVLHLPLNMEAGLLASGVIDIRIEDHQGNALLSYRTDGTLPAKPDLSARTRPAKTAPELFARGYDLETKDRPRAARECYRQALRREPSHSASLAHLALLSLKAFDFAGADRYLAKIRVKDDFHRYLAGMCALFQGKHEAAERLLSAIGARAPYFTTAVSAIVRCCLNRGDVQSAAAAAARLRSKDPRGLALKALVNRLQGKTGQAIEAVTSGLALDPLDPALKAEAERLNLGCDGPRPDPWETSHFYLELGMWADARRELERIDSRTLLQQYSLGYCLFKLGDEAGSRAAFAAATALDIAGVFPSTFVEWKVLDHVIRNHLDPRAPFLLANLLFSRGRTNEAVTLWEKALPHLPDSSVAYRNLGFAYAFRKKDRKTARKYYLAALERDPGNGLAAQELLSICDARQDKALLRKLHRLWSGFPLRQDSSKRAFVKLLVRLGEHAQAVSFFEHNRFEAMENNYEIRGLYTQAHLGLARLQFTAGTCAEALATARQCLVFPPRSGAGSLFRDDLEEAYLLCARIRESMGDIGGALSDYRKCLEADRERQDPLRPLQLQALAKLNQYAKIGIVADG